ncbi:ABC transporter ATP-binding protein [Cohnella sp. GCM10027633]|uniref:ABC transporter ATP-binding protein n=1 Tax=unclassified Cohnella TaxID=2636738 RepID=UPI0036257492
MAEISPAIDVQELTFRYPGADDSSLNGLSLRVERGEFVAVIGSNGSGKSSLCKALTGLIPHYYAGEMEGSARVGGMDTREAGVSRLAYAVGYVSQDFDCQLVRPTVRQEAEFAPMNFGHADYEERAMRALDRLGIGHLKDRYIWQLSGGQKHIAALASILSLDPGILIVDEPAAELDPFHAEAVYELLRRLNETERKTIVVIEHHAEWIARYCDSVVLVSEGRVVWKKPVAEALSLTEELRKHHIFPPQVTQIAERLGVRTAAGHYPINLSECASALRPLAPEPAANEPEPASTRIGFAEAPGDSSTPPQAAPFKLTQASYAYPTMDKRDHAVFQELDLSVFPGERVALVGGNGAGKSTLLRMMTGLVKPSGGTVELYGRSIRKPEDSAGLAAYIYQKPESMLICDNVRDEITYFGRARRLPDADELTDSLLDKLHLRELSARDARLLSGGQQRRVSLAIGLSMKPRLLLLDEPTASLDVVSRKEMAGLLDRIGEEVEAVVVATHDMQLVAEWANRVVVLHQGRIVADTTPARLFASRDAWTQWGLVAPQTVELSNELRWTRPALTVEQFVAAFELARDRKEAVADVAY